MKLFSWYTTRKCDGVQFWDWDGRLNVIGLAGIRPAKVGLGPGAALTKMEKRSSRMNHGGLAHR